ncbi:hypothetical protein D3C71_1787340 [compost metagenome]
MLCGKHITDAQVKSFELCRLNGLLVLFQFAAESGYIGYARCTQQLSAHHPVLDGTQVGQGIFMLIAVFGF